jgi:tRNA uridine 5-carboxymethylaminomethyl modification enzyme
VRPGDVAAESLIGALSREMRALDLLRRPEVRYQDVVALERVGAIEGNLTDELLKQLARSLEVNARYAGYIERQAQEIERQRRHMDTPLPPDIDYGAVAGLSNEVREKLARIRPENVGQAARISGMTPAAVSLLLIHLKKTEQRKIA